MVVSVSNPTPDSVLSMSQVTSSLLNEETRRKTAGTDNAQAFVTEKRGRSKSRGPKGVMASLEVDHRLRKNLENASIVARRVTLKRIALP